MVSAPAADFALRNAAVPRALVADPAAFGGAPDSDCLVGDLQIAGGRVAALLPAGATPPSAADRDLAGRIVLPRLAEAHCHLDKCHTVGRLGPVGGDLHAAIEAQGGDKARWSEDDIRRRAGRGLAELERAGCGAVRTHVDWDPELVPERRLPLAWGVLGEIGAAYAGRLTLQRCALLAAEVFADRAAAERAVRLLADEPGAVLGVFVFDQPEKRAWLRTAFELAASYRLPLDFHVDEGLADGLDGLAAIAELAVETRFPLPVLCGHACSLANLEGEPLRRVIGLVAAAGLSVVSLPTTNLYLQGRLPGSPQRRGLTRLRELAAAGVPVVVGSDNVCDAFCPLGAHDPMAALATGALAAHLDPPYGPWLAAVTTSARRALGLPPLYLDQAAAADLLVADAVNTAEVVAGAPRRPLLGGPAS